MPAAHRKVRAAGEPHWQMLSRASQFPDSCTPGPPRQPVTVLPPPHSIQLWRWVQMSTCGPDRRPPTRTTWSGGYRKVLLCEMQVMEVGEQCLGMTLCNSPASLSIHGHTHARDQHKAPKDLPGEHVVPGTHCYQVDRDHWAKRQQDTELDAYRPDSPRPKCYMEIHTAPT